jgi:hypothetical protein
MKSSRERRQRWGERRYRGGSRECASHPAGGPNAGANNAGDRNPKERRGGVSCGAVRTQRREMVTQGVTTTLIAETLAISRSNLYYRKEPRGNRADHSYDEQVVMVCREELGSGYRCVAWGPWRKKGLRVNRKRVLRVMRELGLPVRSRPLCARRKKEWGCRGSRWAQACLTGGHDQSLGRSGGELRLSRESDRCRV